MALFSWVNHVDDAATILTASHTAGDLSISNVADSIIGRRWRTTTLTAWGQADFGADKSTDIVSLRFPRDTTLPTAGTVRHYFDADGGTPGTGAAHDSTAIAIDVTDGYGYHVYKPATTVSARYWRWTFAITGVTFIDVGRAWAGEVLEPTHDVAFGYGEEWFDLSRVSAARRSGAQYVDEMARQRIMAFSLNAITAADRATVRDMDRLTGISGQILFVLDTATATTETVLGRLARVTPITRPHITTAALYAKNFQIVESN